jgi:hypothetical protein
MQAVYINFQENEETQFLCGLGIHTRFNLMVQRFSTVVGGRGRDNDAVNGFVLGT